MWNFSFIIPGGINLALGKKSLLLSSFKCFLAKKSWPANFKYVVSKNYEAIYIY